MSRNGPVNYLADMLLGERCNCPRCAASPDYRARRNRSKVAHLCPDPTENPDCCWACVLDECPHEPHPADPERGGKPCECECAQRPAVTAVAATVVRGSS